MENKIPNKWSTYTWKEFVEKTKKELIEPLLAEGLTLNEIIEALTYKNYTSLPKRIKKSDL